jgi:hypothetical protein
MTLKAHINILLFLFASLTIRANAQNLFPVKLDNCNVKKFCLDCGDIKAGVDQSEFIKLLVKLNKELNLNGIRGSVKFQVLVDSEGRACVLSHTDQTNHPITLKIIEELNKFKKWTPAKTSGKPEEKSSINLIFSIDKNKISGQVERVDMQAFNKSFDKPRSPEIYNKTYVYKNVNWTKYDPTAIGIDGAYEIVNNQKSGEVFFCSDEGLTIYKDGKWTNLNNSKLKDLPSNRVTFAKRDSKNRIWIGTFSGTAMIDENNQVTNFENSNTVLKGKCITSMDEDENGNLFFTLYEFDRKDKEQINNNEGIAIRYADGTFKQFTTENSGLPFNHTNCVLYDKTEKVLWISTDRAGLVRYDLKDGWENYHNENSDIPTSYISTMTFDNEGNLYLGTRQGLVKIERKD